jgi:hypothetical protein
MSDPDHTDKVVAAIFTAGMLAREDADTAKYLHVYERFLEAIKNPKQEKPDAHEVGTLFSNPSIETAKRKPATLPRRKKR